MPITNPVTSTGDVKPGTAFSVELKDGQLEAIAAGDGGQTLQPKPRPKSKPSGPETQGDLF